MLNKFKNEDPACVTKKETTATFLCLTQKHSCLAEECSLKCHFKQREVQTKLEHGLVTHTHTKKTQQGTCVQQVSATQHKNSASHASISGQRLLTKQHTPRL